MKEICLNFFTSAGRSEWLHKRELLFGVMKEANVNNFREDSFFTEDEKATQQIIFGIGAINRAGEASKKLGSNVLLVTDSGLSSVGHPQKLKAILEQSNLNVTLFDQSTENPTESSVQSCVQVAKEAQVDLIVGLGGGSSMDTAKGCNFILSNGGKMSDYWGIDKAHKPMLPLVAIPTTAGTGSECQSFALISEDQTHKKMACGDKKALPQVTILDPELTLSLPNSVTACTGVDALAHALESIVTTQRNPSSIRHAQLAFDLIQVNLPLVFQDPQDLESRGKVLLGASHAGAAIERSMLGAAHSMANPLTASRGVVHGIAVGMVLPEVIKFNAVQTETNHIYAEVARKSGLAGLGSSDFEATQSLIDRVSQILKLANIPSSLEEQGFVPTDIQTLALAATEQWTANFNPRPVEEEDFKNLYSQLFSSIPCTSQPIQAN
jgi:alcohol dehydrogenase